MIRFSLKIPKSNTSYSYKGKTIGIIHVEMKFDAGLRLRRSLQMKITMDDWILERQRVKPQAQGAMEVNMVLNQIESKFQELNHRVRYTGEQLSIQLVEDEILHAFKNGGIRSKQKQKKPLEFFNEYLESCRHRLSDTSIKAYQSAIKHLQGYSDVHRAPITWDLFDRDFGEAFIQYLTSRNISNNTVGKYVMSLKILLKQAMLKRLLHTEFFRDYRVDKAPIEFVYLTSEELDAIIRSAFYHPIGSRGVGLYRAQSFGQGFDSYINKKSKEIKIIAQIEHHLAMENLGEILNFEKLSGVFIGPYDLSSSLGIPGDFTNPEFLKHIKRFESECSKSNKLMGMHIVYPDNTLLREKIAKGYNFIAYGTDLLLLQESFNQIEL